MEKTTGTESKEDKFEFIIIPRNVLQDERLNGSSKILYGYLKFRTNENDYCWPGYKTIHRDLNLNRATISSSIKQLVKLGWMTYVRGSRGSRGSNRYYLNSSPQLNQTDGVEDGLIFKLSQNAWSVMIIGLKIKLIVGLGFKLMIGLISKPYMVYRLNCKRTLKRKGLKEKVLKEEGNLSSFVPEDLKGESPLKNPPVEEERDERIKTEPQSQESNSVMETAQDMGFPPGMESISVKEPTQIPIDQSSLSKSDILSDRWRCTHPTFADLKHVSLDGKGVEEIIKTSEGELTRDNFVKLTLDEIASNLAFWDKQKSEKEILHRSPEKPTPLPGAVAEIPKPKVEVAPRYGRDISKLESLQQGMEVPTEIKAQTLPPAVAEIDPKVKAQIDRYELGKVKKNEFVKTQQVKFLEKMKAMPQEFRERIGFTDEKISELEQAAANRQPFQLSTTPKTTLEEIADEKQLELRQRIEANKKQSRGFKADARRVNKEKWFEDHPGATKEDWKFEKELDKALKEAPTGGFRGFFGGPQTGRYSEEEIAQQGKQFQLAGVEAGRIRGTVLKEIAAAKPKTAEEVLDLEIKGEGAGTIYEQRTKQQYINNKVTKGEWPSKYFKAISRGVPKAKSEPWHGGGPLGFGGQSGKVSPPTVKEIKELGDKLIKGESVSVMETAQDMGFPPGIERANSQDQKATPLLPQNNQVEIGIPDTPPPEKPKAKKSRAKPKEPRDDSVDPLKDTDGLPKVHPMNKCPEHGVFLVLKHRRSDGEHFYGCPTYRETGCKYVLPRHIDAINREPWTQEWADNLPDD